MEAQHVVDSASSWSSRRPLKPRAYALAAGLVILFGLAYLLSSDTDLQFLTASSSSQRRQPRKLGDFSANGETYRSLSSPRVTTPGALSKHELAARKSKAIRKKQPVSSKEIVQSGGTGMLIERVGNRIKAKAAAARVGKSAPAQALLTEAEVRQIDSQIELEKSETLGVEKDTVYQEEKPFTSVNGSASDELVEHGEIPSLEELEQQKLSEVTEESGSSLGVFSLGQKGYQEEKVKQQPLAEGEQKNSKELSRIGLVEAIKSSAECIRDADGTDICHYGQAVCYDSEQRKLVLIDDERKGEEFASAIIFQDGRWTLGRLPPESKWPLPISNKIEGVWEGQEILSNATFLDGALWIVRPETDNTNHIWHNGLSFTGLLQAQLRNTSGVFPPLDHVLVLNRTAAGAGYTDYNLGMLNIVSQEHTKLLFTKDLPQDKSLLCARRGAMTSYKPSWSTGPLDASELRARAYEHLKVPRVDKADWRRVTIVNRPQGFPRHVENADEIVKMVNELGLEANLVQEVPGQARSFREQVLTMAETGILIAPHGGGLANLAWLPENAAVIELFPNKCVQTEYRNMAAVRNLLYFSVEAVNYTHPQALAEFSLEEIARCQGLHSIDHSHDGVCNQVVKNYPFKVPIAKLERTIQHALEHFFTLEVPFPLQKRL